MVPGREAYGTLLLLLTLDGVPTPFISDSVKEVERCCMSVEMSNAAVREIKELKKGPAVSCCGQEHKSINEFTA